MSEYLTTQQLFEELQRRWEHDANVSEELASESNELQERIDKAIEYIEHYLEEDRINCGNIYHSVYDELLDILKGSDKE